MSFYYVMHFANNETKIKAMNESGQSKSNAANKSRLHTRTVVFPSSFSIIFSLSSKMQAMLIRSMKINATGVQTMTIYGCAIFKPKPINRALLQVFTSVSY